MLKFSSDQYRVTFYACYVGYITQAIVNGFAPLLFLTFSNDFHLTLDQIAVIPTLNFFMQLLLDLLAAPLVARTGYRKAAILAHICAGAGLIGLPLLPRILPNAYGGLLLAVALYAVGGGLCEVLLSPLVQSCPSENKEAAMSVLHSFYCWGQVALVLLSTLFFRVVGIGSWGILSCLLAIIPLANAVLFTAVPMPPQTSAHHQSTHSVKGLLHRQMFWLMAALMVCGGAAELAMSQWVSAFAEAALSLDKTVGDIAGPCAFAVCMGLARIIHAKFSDRISLHRVMTVCAAMALICYLAAALIPTASISLLACALCGAAVGIFFPGVYSLAAASIPSGGTAMFAYLALAGDIGCILGPSVVGMAAELFSGSIRMGLLCSAVFPLLALLLCTVITSRHTSCE